MSHVFVLGFICSSTVDFVTVEAGSTFILFLLCCLPEEEIKGVICGGLSVGLAGS